MSSNQPNPRIWIRPGDAEYSTVPLNYDGDDIEYALVVPSSDAEVAEIRGGVAPLLACGVECLDCSRLLGYIQTLLQRDAEREAEIAELKARLK